MATFWLEDQKDVDLIVAGQIRLNSTFHSLVVFGKMRSRTYDALQGRHTV